MVPLSWSQLLLQVLYSAFLCNFATPMMLSIGVLFLMLHPLLHPAVYMCPSGSEVLATSERQERQSLAPSPELIASLSPTESCVLEADFSASSLHTKQLEEHSLVNGYELHHDQRVDTLYPVTRDVKFEAEPPFVFSPGHLTSENLSGQRELPIPTTIPTRLVICLEDLDGASKSYTHHKYFQVKWQEADSFEKCVKTAERFLKVHLEPQDSFFMSSAQYRIVKQAAPDKLDSWLARRRAQERQSGVHSDEIELYSESVENHGSWQWNLPRMLSKQLIIEADAKLFIEVALSYTQYTPHPTTTCDRASCTATIRDTLLQARIELPKNRLNHVQDAWFVSAELINKFFTTELIQHLVDNDVALQQDVEWIESTDQDRKRFVILVHAYCTRLLASSILAELDLRCIFYLIQKDKSDVDIPLAKADQRLLPYLSSSIPSLAFEGFIRYQGSFKAHSFQSLQEPKDKDNILMGTPYRAPREHEEIDHNIVIPILESKPLENGANATVYDIRLHGDHHSFSPDRTKHFALKHIVRDRMLNDIRHESRILEKLAKVPHPHLTTLLASWSQLDSCSILLPLAKENLSSMMTASPGPTLQGCFVRWLLRQMSGLAAALDHIHNLGPADLGPEHLDEDGNRSKAGYHHDLHPGNILVFENDVLRISDFGTARIQQVLGSGKVSYKSPRTRGHSDYEAPDKTLNQKASRPHDVWALGCIFLEMLVWASGHSVKKFEEAREQARETEGQTAHDASFWYSKNGTVQLKQVVKEKIQRLRFLHQRKHVFKTLLGLIESMLRTESQPEQPNPRPPISAVLSVLQKMISQAELDLSHYGENYFLKTLSLQSGKTFGAPSDVVDGKDIGDDENHRKELDSGNLQVPRTLSHVRRNSTGDFRRSDQIPNLSTATTLQILPSSDHESDLAQTGVQHTGEDHIPTPGTPSFKFTHHDEEQSTPSSIGPLESCLNGICALNPSLHCPRARIDAESLEQITDAISRPEAYNPVRTNGVHSSFHEQKEDREQNWA